MVTGLNGQSGVVRGPGGAFYVATWGTADRPGTTIHRITPDGATSVFAEGGGILTAQPLAFDDDGYRYVGNAVSGAIHRIDATGLVEPFVELPPLIGNRVHFGRVLYVTAPTERRVLRIDIVSRQISVLAGSGESALLDGIGEEASFVAPWGIAITPDGRELWVSDAGSRGQDQIRRIVLDM